MGLTYQSSGRGALRESFIGSDDSVDYVVALAGNPNTGKSTVFNALTGLRQHTGNWPGKTVTQARGNYSFGQRKVTLVDLPGTYSLLANSPEEQVARDFICFAEPDATVIVVDATCLERNLNLVLQVTEITAKAILCLNLMDEAKRKRLSISAPKLQEELGIPVIPTIARSGVGLTELKSMINKVSANILAPQPFVLKYDDVLEEKIQLLVEKLGFLPERFNKRWIALRLIDGDYSIIQSVEEYMKVV